MTPENALVSRRVVFERDGVLTLVEVWDTSHPDSPFIRLDGAALAVPHLRGFQMTKEQFENWQPRLKPDESEQDDDPSANKRWQAGCDFAMVQLCSALGVDPKSVRWDAATETLDGDVIAVIWNILRAKMGDEWDPDKENPPNARARLEVRDTLIETLEAENARLLREIAGEREQYARLDRALRQKDEAMGVLFERLAHASVDCSDLIP